MDYQTFMTGKIDAFAHVFPRPVYEKFMEVNPSEELAALDDATELWDVDQRVADMDEFGVDKQVLTLARPPIWRGMDPEDALPLTRLANDLVREVTDEHPDRFIPVATLPFATDAYVDRYGGPDAEPNAALYDRLNDTLRPGSVAWHANLAYVDGRDYVGERVGTASGLSVVYDSPPRTSEQVIHGLSPVEEPAAPLDVTTSGDEWRVAATDRLGEAFLRTALAGTLDAGRAARAAAGWGNDTLYTFRRPDAANGSYAWVQRWDTAADAREYLDAQRDALDERGTAAGDGWRVAGVSVEVRRVGPRTTALVAGDAAFVDGTTVDGDGRDVAVRAP